MITRILLAIVVGVIAGGLCFLVGLILTLLPFVAPVGAFLEAVSPVVGLIAAVVYFLTGRTTLL